MICVYERRMNIDDNERQQKQIFLDVAAVVHQCRLPIIDAFNLGHPCLHLHHHGYWIPDLGGKPFWTNLLKPIWQVGDCLLKLLLDLERKSKQ